MNAPVRKGWCPTLMTPMESGDGLLVRVKPTAARLTARAAPAIAEAAARWGNRLIDLTNRGNLQVRGLAPDTVEPFAAVVAAEGLAAADPDLEAVRNVLADPLGPDDPGVAFDSHALARALEAMMATEPRLVELPGKFGHLVDGGGAISLARCRADIMLRADGDALAIILDGGCEAARVTADEAVDAVRGLMHAFLDQRDDCGARRMRDLVAAVGASAVFGHVGLACAPGERGTRAVEPRPIGFIRISDDVGAFGVGAPFGQIEAKALGGLADLADQFGDGTLRVTPWKALLSPGIEPDQVETVRARAERLGLIVEPDDPRRNIVACAGMPACASATVDARGDAALLAEQHLTNGAVVHVSGCAKGCAHPYPADLTLVGESGFYAIVRGGYAGDEPDECGLLAPKAAIARAAAMAGEPSR